MYKSPGFIYAGKRNYLRTSARSVFSIIPDKGYRPELFKTTGIQLFYVAAIFEHLLDDSVERPIRKESGRIGIGGLQHDQPGIAASCCFPYLFDPAYQLTCFKGLFQLQGQQAPP